MSDAAGLCAVAFGVAVVATLWKRRNPPEPPIIRCAVCDYNLAGLPTTSRCPECGRKLHIAQAQRVFQLCPDRIPLILLSITLMAALVWLGRPAAEWLVLWSYRLDGYLPQTAMNAARARELARTDTVLLLLPLSIAITISPLAAWLGPGRKRWIAMGLLLLIGALATVARWAVYALR